MGYGDAIMATALARGFHKQGKLAAFFAPAENQRKIKWTGYCEDIFANNPNIARPGAERNGNLVWFPHYKKQFPYCKYDGARRKYIWSEHFKAQAGEFFFSAEEKEAAQETVTRYVGGPFIAIEPNLAWQRQVNVNKDWGEGKYEALAKALLAHGLTLVQFIHGNSRRRIAGALQVPSPLFRQAAAIMAHARLIIAPEGANHHAAAALGVPAVIVWGDWSPAERMGYAGQVKLTGKQPPQACGHTFNCEHCRQAMNSIAVDEVYQAALGELH
jgi:ADP-heptose:LPS heptosyltransferase